MGAAPVSVAFRGRGSSCLMGSEFMSMWKSSESFTPWWASNRASVRKKAPAKRIRKMLFLKIPHLTYICTYKGISGDLKFDVRVSFVSVFESLNWNFFSFTTNLSPNFSSGGRTLALGSLLWDLCEGVKV